MAEAAIEHMYPEPRRLKILSLVGDITNEDVAIRSEYNVGDLNPDVLKNPNFRDDSSKPVAPGANVTDINIWEG